MSALETLRRRAVARSLFLESDLRRAIERLGFVQADPIRAPARAQDLILHQRVAGYRAGDLERGFKSLALAEDVLHVYGFLPSEQLPLLHPRGDKPAWRVDSEHPHLRRAILDHLKRHGPTHPRALNELLGGASVVNAWGGRSAATTRMLEALHYEGRLTVVGREAGIRIYAPTARRRATLTPSRRAEGLVFLLAQLYAPLSIASFRQLLAAVGGRAPAGILMGEVLQKLIAKGRLRVDRVDDVPYLSIEDEPSHADIEDRVRFLAPFDPVVWDRRRFEHLWGWRYRFEAYTPPAKRQFGYYALPLLWRSDVIGWANLAVDRGRLAPTLGYVDKPPRERTFKRALEEELARMERFLGAVPDGEQAH